MPDSWDPPPTRVGPGAAQPRSPDARCHRRCSPGRQPEMCQRAAVCKPGSPPRPARAVSPAMQPARPRQQMHPVGRQQEEPPPGRSSRAISRNAAAGVARCSSTQDATTMSNEPLGEGEQFRWRTTARQRRSTVGSRVSRCPHRCRSTGRSRPAARRCPRGHIPSPGCDSHRRERRRPKSGNVRWPGSSRTSAARTGCDIAPGGPNCPSS